MGSGHEGEDGMMSVVMLFDIRGEHHVFSTVARDLV
jgi:hypothetical protein